MSQEEINEFVFSGKPMVRSGTPEYTRAHEIRHNLGCFHNREVENDTIDYLFLFAFEKDDPLETKEFVQ